MSELRRREMLGVHGWLVTFGYLIGSAVVYGVAVTAFCGFLIASNSTPEAQREAISFLWVMMYVGLGLIPVGNIIWWWVRWDSYRL